VANLPVALFIGTDIMSHASKSSVIKARIKLSEKTQKKGPSAWLCITPILKVYLKHAQKDLKKCQLLHSSTELDFCFKPFIEVGLKQKMAQYACLAPLHLLENFDLNFPFLC